MARFIPTRKGVKACTRVKHRWIAEETGEWRGRVKARFEESD